MLQYKMRCLLLNSIVCVLLMGCASSYKDLKPVQADPACLAKFKPVFKTTWYNASIDVVGKHLSGLLLFKTMPDSTIRVVFTNEVGITFFDFEFTPTGDFKVKQVIEQLDKDAVITLLRKDFELIMMKGAKGSSIKTLARGEQIFYAVRGKKETDYFITDKDCGSLLKIEKASKRKKKTEVILMGERAQAPDSVFLKHYTFNMQIGLKKILR